MSTYLAITSCFLKSIPCWKQKESHRQLKTCFCHGPLPKTAGNCSSIWVLRILPEPPPIKELFSGFLGEGECFLNQFVVCGVKFSLKKTSRLHSPVAPPSGRGRTLKALSIAPSLITVSDKLSHWIVSFSYKSLEELSLFIPSQHSQAHLTANIKSPENMDSCPNAGIPRSSRGLQIQAPDPTHTHGLSPIKFYKFKRWVRDTHTRWCQGRHGHWICCSPL